jgi:hypothetical protein
MGSVKFTIVGSPQDLTVSQCTFCAHRSSDATTCKAFPRGIPAKILMNEHDHALPFKGDNGIRYTPVRLEARGKVPA